MIDTILFDMDGVLFDDKDVHYECLNIALGERYSIPYDLHLSVFDGLQTRKKLQILTEKYGLPENLHDKVWKDKQAETVKRLVNLGKDQRLCDVFSELHSAGYKLGVCSNSVRKTVLMVLSNLGIMKYLDIVFSNDDVLNSKPHPEMYWKAMSGLRTVPENVLILEDSPNGLKAAHRSGASVLRVKDPSGVTLDKILEKINSINQNPKPTKDKWEDKSLNIVIPMAGAGKRFADAGYSFPKPLIDIKGKPMIQVVVENLNIDANYIYLVQKEHNERYNISTMLNLLTPNCKVLEVDEITEGAACTALIAKDLINNSNPVLFANSDQYIDWDSSDFMYRMSETEADGGILTFESYHPKWSFAKVDSKGLVVEVAEKNPISNEATVGLYYWKMGSDFVKYAEQMIEKNLRVNGEFYICPVYNEAILDSKSIITSRVSKMWGLGTPEDLKAFLDSNP